MKEIIVGFVLLFCSFGGAYGCVKAFPETTTPPSAERTFAGIGILILGTAGLTIIGKGCGISIFQ